MPLGLSIATTFCALYSAAVVSFNGGRDRAAALPLPRADDDASGAYSDGDIRIPAPPITTPVVITVPIDLQVDALRHFEIFRLGRDGPHQQRCSHEYSRGCRHGKSDRLHLNIPLLDGLDGYEHNEPE